MDEIKAIDVTEFEALGWEPTKLGARSWWTFKKGLHTLRISKHRFDKYALYAKIFTAGTRDPVAWTSWRNDPPKDERNRIFMSVMWAELTLKGSKLS